MIDERSDNPTDELSETTQEQPNTPDTSIDVLPEAIDESTSSDDEVDENPIIDETIIVQAPGRTSMCVDGRSGSEACSGSTAHLRWGARTDVGLVRNHNEDSYLLQAPLFCVSDGMGGHAAGEVASRITVETLAKETPATSNDVQLGESIEKANHAIIDAAVNGEGKPGMGCTATAVCINENMMAVGHVGDSRCYVLHAGKLVRVTHDHSFVEELVDAGEITADEARVHPSRSVITRALGSDPDMYADHFLIEVNEGDRIIVCSDGLNSMVPDAVIESLAVSSVTPQQAADSLVAEALTQGGHDNVTVIVIDVSSDTREDNHLKMQEKFFKKTFKALAIFLAIVFISTIVLIRSSWYIGMNNQNVALYRGLNSNFLGLPLSSLAETTDIPISQLPQGTQTKLIHGIVVDSEESARITIESYRDQIRTMQEKAQHTAKDTGLATSTNSTTSNTEGAAHE